VPELKLQEMFYEEQSFNAAIERSRDVKPRAGVRAIIVPHHLLAGHLITETIKVASNPGIERVIVVGPNHRNVGGQRISTALVNWQTPLGVLRSDPILVDSLRSSLGLMDSPDVFTNEHSIGAEAPFIKYFFPQASTLGIALGSNVTYPDALALSRWLAKNADSKTLIVFSVDFSHYLSKAVADEMDKVTEKLIEQRDVNKILQLGNDNMDSPGTVATALLLADELDLRTEILQRGNSFDLLTIKPNQTTSYFTISFHP
jgi:AmmeMemoRadiSam system protein B